MILYYIISHGICQSGIAIFANKIWADFFVSGTLDNKAFKKTHKPFQKNTCHVHKQYRAMLARRNSPGVMPVSRRKTQLK